MTREEYELVSKIGDRARDYGYKKSTVFMDICRYATAHEMDLEKLLESSEGDFLHDIVHIHHRDEFFVPRCSR